MAPVDTDEPELPAFYVFFARIPLHKSLIVLTSASLLIAMVLTMPDYLLGIGSRLSAVTQTLSLAGIILTLLVAAILIRYLAHYLLGMPYFKFYFSLNAYGEAAIIMLITAISMLLAKPLSGTISLAAAALFSASLFPLAAIAGLYLFVGLGMGLASANVWKGLGAELAGMLAIGALLQAMIFALPWLASI